MGWLDNFSPGSGAFLTPDQRNGANNMGLIQAGLNLIDSSSNKVGLRPSMLQIAGQGVGGYGQGVQGYMGGLKTSADTQKALSESRLAQAQDKIKQQLASAYMNNGQSVGMQPQTGTAPQSGNTAAGSTPRDLSSFYQDQSRAYFAAGDSATGKAYLDKAVEIDPTIRYSNSYSTSQGNLPSDLTKIGAQGQQARMNIGAQGAETRKTEDYKLQNGVGSLDDDTTEQVAQLIAKYQMAPPTAFALRSANGQKLMARVAKINPEYQAQTYGQRAAAYKAFGSGTQGNTVRSLGVANAHLDTLSKLADALQNGDVKAVNSIGNYFSKQTGQTAPTSFGAARNMVANEIVKAVTASGGTLEDRKSAQADISSANSPEQLQEVISTYKQLMSGQLEGLKGQYEYSTGRKDFDSLLPEEARNEIAGRDAKDNGASDSEGDTASGPNGQKLIFKSGQWVPYE